MNNPPLLEIKNLTVTYPHGSQGRDELQREPSSMSGSAHACRKAGAQQDHLLPGFRLLLEENPCL